MKRFTSIHKTLFVAFVAATVLCVSTSTNAQVPSVNLKPRLYLAGGTSMIASPTASKDMLNKSFSLMAAVGLPLNTGFEIIPKMHYHKFSISTDFLLAASITVEDPKMSILTLGADMKMGLIPGPVPTKPYFLIGGGTASITQDALGALPSISSTKFYANFGGGIDIKAGPSFAFFVEGKYTFVSSSGVNLGILPIMAGIRIM